jgi:tRNA A-37 threonylcarbamoyl transferase component Bud32
MAIEKERHPILPEKEIGDEYKETRLEVALTYALENSEYHDEGNNGYVLFFDISNVPKEILDSLNIPIEEAMKGAAIKVLKVYQKGMMEAEFKNQLRAYQIVEDNKGKIEELAKVPKPYSFFSEVRINEKTKRKFKNVDFRGDVAELMIMDFIPGEDIATIFFREVIRLTPVPYARVTWDDKRIRADELQTEVKRRLDLPTYVTGQRSVSGIPTPDERDLYNKNAKAMMKVLEGRSVFDKTIYEQIKNTMALFRNNDFVIDDAHDRNFMIVGDWHAEKTDPNSPRPQVYVIDFGKVGGKDDQMIGEGSVENKILNLTKNSAQINLEHYTDRRPVVRGGLMKTEILLKRQKTDKYWAKIEKALAESGPERAAQVILEENYSELLMKSGLAIEIMIARFEMLRRNNLIDDGTCVRLIDSIRKKELGANVSNTLDGYKEYLKK